jgi:hypothetical protein
MSLRLTVIRHDVARLMTDTFPLMRYDLVEFQRRLLN